LASGTDIDGRARPAPERPAELVCPSTVAEAADLLAAASRDGRRISIEREGGDVVLSTGGLDRILEHEAGDLTATVEGGVRLSALRDRLAEAGQMLALDPPGDPTIGACVAGSRSGPRRHRYGAVRDLVLGVTIVLADGTVANAGGKVVKNVAGYDLGKLFCGSNGRFGLIARVSLRLHPLPEAATTVVVPVTDAEHAHSLWRLLHHSQLVPSAVDLLWGGDPTESWLATQFCGALAVLFEGSRRAVEAQAGAARGLLGGDIAGEEIWEGARARQAALPGRISFPPGRLAAALLALPEALARPGVGSAFVQAQLGDEGDAGAWALTERVRAALDPGGVLV
jgi:glycolate oxidase FAD binding subunit